LTFKRLADLSKDPQVIVDAVKDSTIVKVSDDKLSVKRIDPIPDEDTGASRTVYVKGWTVGTTIEQIEDTLSQHGKVLSVRIRRGADKQPKDSAFVEFSTEEETKKAVDSKTTVGDKTLLIMLKADYAKKKKDEKEKRKLESGDNDDNNNSKKKKSKKNYNNDNNESEKRDLTKYPVGILLSVKNIGEGVTREVFKELLGVFGEVAFVDFKQNDTEGVIRFATPEGAKKAIEGLTEKKVKIGDKIPELAILTEPEEEIYFKKVKEQQQQRKILYKN